MQSEQNNASPIHIRFLHLIYGFYIGNDHHLGTVVLMIIMDNPGSPAILVFCFRESHKRDYI